MEYTTTQLENALKYLKTCESEISFFNDKIYSTLKRLNCENTQELENLIKESEKKIFDFEGFKDELESELQDVELIEELYQIAFQDDIQQDLHIYDGEQVTEELESKINQVLEDYRHIDNQICGNDFSVQWGYGSQEYRVIKKGYEVEAAEDYLRDYVEYEVLSQLPYNLQEYFDTDRYIEDVIQSDGVGHLLASYDSEERETSEYYVYRTN